MLSSLFPCPRRVANVPRVGRLKILHVLSSLEPGGMEIGVANVAKRLPEDEFEVHVCCLERGGAFVERLPHPERVTILHKLPGFSLRAAAGVARVIRRVGVDVVHSHNLGPLTYSVLATGLGLWRPILQGEHGVFQPGEDTPRRRLQRRWMNRCCRRIHTVSESLRRFLIEHGYPGETIVPILNDVDTERFKPLDRAAMRRCFGLPTEGQFVGIVRRFDPRKKHVLLIEAFNRGAARLEGLSNALLEAMPCGVPALDSPDILARELERVVATRRRWLRCPHGRASG